MKNHFFLVVIFISTLSFSQTDYSDSWEDFYSYNNVKDFIVVANRIYALADNAVFIYNIDTKETKKLSSVQGLSGETTTAIYYNTTFKRLVIGYQNGGIEVVDENNEITISSDIVNFNQSGEKSINHISGFETKLYLSTPFGIVVYDIEKLEFGDTYFIGNNSNAVNINETVIFNNQIYAATEVGIFNADVSNPLLIDFNNWQQNFSGRDFKQINAFNNQLITVENTNVFSINGPVLSLIRDFTENVVSIKTSNSHLSIALPTKGLILDTSLNPVFQSLSNSEFNFTLNNVLFDNNNIFLATKEFGILTTTEDQSLTFTEIHPEGPLANSSFSIAVRNNNLWIVYGGYDDAYTPLQQRKGFSHFNGENWVNTRFDSSFPVIDLNYIAIDPNSENKVYISSFGDTRDINSVSTGGMLVVENDEISAFYNHLNSGLEDLVPNESDRVSLRISGSTFDRQGNLWIANISNKDELKKLSQNGQWSSFNISELKTIPDKYGLSEIAIDNNNSIWMGTRRNGIYVFNENGNRKRALVTTINNGNLPDTDVKTVAIDQNNRVWMGTRSGMVVYNNAAGIFDENILNAEPVIILDDGIPKKLLGDQTINSIAIDGAENKWFGTDNGGVLYTNPNGQTTLANFSSQNSPLPSNRILKISVDESSGKVFFATDKGIVAYNSKVSPFGDRLGDIYAYPNPALKTHEFITIDGRNGTYLPKGTNVKILDVAGNLVYETNVIEGQELQGGKVVWNKTNLAGTPVASGIYIVLMSNDDASETSVTKIAIVN
jgi:ligand-binding sensor domain-containing protein